MTETPGPPVVPGEATYEWSRDLIRKSVWRFLSRFARPSLVLAIVLLALGIFSMLAGYSAWMSGLFIGTPFGLGLVWLRYYLMVTRIYDQMRDRRVTVRIEPESITFRTSEHVSTMKWSMIKQAWSFADMLLLFTYGRTNYVGLPVAAIGPELKRYVEERIRQHGGKVT